MRRFLISAFLVSIGIAKGDVITSVTCAANGYSSISNAAQCVQGTGLAYGPGVEARGAVSATVSMPNVPSNYLTADISESVSEVPALGLNMVGPSSAWATASISLNLSTLGPVRQGFLQIYAPTLSWIDAPEGYSGQMNLSLGSITGSCQSAGSLTCRIGTYYLAANGTLLLPFTLGDSFSFQITESDSVNGDVDSGDSEGTDQTAISFRLLEADGATPVALYDPPATAPEPATFGILSLGVAGLVLAARLKRGRSVRN